MLYRDRVILSAIAVGVALDIKESKAVEMLIRSGNLERSARGVVVTENGMTHILKSEGDTDIHSETLNHGDEGNKLRLSKLRVISLWPEGMKDVNGKLFAWRMNSKEIDDRLDKLFQWSGYKVSDDELFEAAQEYVNSVDVSLLRTMKNFILVEGTNGSATSSLLLTFCESRKAHALRESNSVNNLGIMFS